MGEGALFNSTAKSVQGRVYPMTQQPVRGERPEGSGHTRLSGKLLEESVAFTRFDWET